MTDDIHVTLLLFAAYREAAGRPRLDIRLPAGSTALSAFDALSRSHESVSRLRPYTTYAVNKTVVRADHPLSDGDEVAFLQPVSGGQHLVEITRDPLDPGRCTDSVRRSGSGGIVTFIGSVRDVSDGKQVDQLDYEAYEPMAISEIEAIIAETEERWPVRAVAVQHRIGTLAVGEDAVVIAVSCPHRGEAFEACRHIIERLKESVPIWKKERSVDGEEWVGGPTTLPR